MRLFASAVVLSLALSGSVFAQTAAETTAPTSSAQPVPTATPAVADKKKDDGIVCHKETPTGSHFPVKVCTTADQRKAERDATRRAQGTMQGGGPGFTPQ